MLTCRGCQARREELEHVRADYKAMIDLLKQENNLLLDRFLALAGRPEAIQGIEVTDDVPEAGDGIDHTIDDEEYSETMAVAARNEMEAFARSQGLKPDDLKDF